jgi:hypothetical protein
LIDSTKTMLNHNVIRGVIILFLAAYVATAPLFAYGRHYPNGASAVQYVYHPQNGTFKYMTKPEYIWNYYENYATAQHPFNRDALIQYASTDGHTTTCRDANGHLLLDFTHSGEIDPTARGSAFHEHNGRGENGTIRGPGFQNFWFDDNSLARVMSAAYNMSLPYGLSQYTDFTRWQIMDGNDQNWIPYRKDYIDTLALDGLYFLKHDQQKSISNYKRILSKSNFKYDQSSQRYVYPGITENYHMGLFLVLTANIYNTKNRNSDILQHLVSLRSNVISNQQKQGNDLLGWTSSIPAGGSLMNTESISAGILGLGAGSVVTYEAGRALSFCTTCTYFMRPHNVLSAVVGMSSKGYLTEGPYVSYWDINPKIQEKCSGGCVVQFFIRVGTRLSPAKEVAVIDVYNSATKAVLQQKVIQSTEFEPNKWQVFELNFPLDQGADAKFEFRTLWNGEVNMDTAFVRIF